MIPIGTEGGFGQPYCGIARGSRCQIRPLFELVSGQIITLVEHGLRKRWASHHPLSLSLQRGHDTYNAMLVPTCADVRRNRLDAGVDRLFWESQELGSS